MYDPYENDVYHEEGAGLARIGGKKKRSNGSAKSSVRSSAKSSVRSSVTSSVRSSNAPSTSHRSSGGKSRRKKKSRGDRAHGHSSSNGDGRKRRKARPKPVYEYDDEVVYEDHDDDYDEEEARRHGSFGAEYGDPKAAAGAAAMPREVKPHVMAHASKKHSWKDMKENLQLMMFFQAAFFNVPILLAAIFYSAVTAVVLHFDYVETSGIIAYLEASKATVAFFSSFLGFSLVFRTNICYGRWWEGRCLWGGLIYSAVNLAHQGKFSLRSREKFRRLCCCIVCFAYASKGQLSESSIEADGKVLLEKGIISRAELSAVVSRSGWQPYYFLTAMRVAIQSDMDARSERNKFSFTSDMQIMDDSMRTLATSIGGLIRVKATGLPIAYDWLFNVIFIIFFTVATLAWTPTLGWYAPVLIVVLNFVVRLIIDIGTALEDPFGDDITDLPMGKFCEAITTQVNAIFYDKITAPMSQCPYSTVK